MEYPIKLDDCMHKENLPRLIQHSINANSSGRFARMLIGDFLKKPQPRFSKHYKKTSFDIEREEKFFRERDRIIHNIREELTHLYQEEPELYSLILFEACSNCKDNPQCSQYQDYVSRIIKV
ncbi:MAG: hypothetical protein Q7R52_05015 [archaeon]|nr:hypothetical protein [archaeon]